MAPLRFNGSAAHPSPPADRFTTHCCGIPFASSESGAITAPSVPGSCIRP